VKVGSNLRRRPTPDIALLMDSVDETGPFVAVAVIKRRAAACSARVVCAQSVEMR